MSTSVDQAFIKQFEREVHTAYQRKGSKFRGTVRTVNNVNGSTVDFQKVGKGTASTKDRHGLVPVMNADHTTVTATLTDFFAGDFVDKLDELKINIDERQVVAEAGAFALGRKTDDIIKTVLDTATNIIAVGTTGMTEAKFLASMSALGDRDVPIDDGDMFFFVGWQEWTELMQIDTFASADFVPASELPFAGAGLFAKRWWGVMVMPHSIIVPDGSDFTTNYMYHRSSVGHAIGADVMSDITWQGERAAHFVNHMMSMGAVLIDNDGIQLVIADRSP